MAMDRETGKEILGVPEIEQSLDTILSVIPGERVMRADYGSRLRRLADIPMNASGRAQVAQETAGAIRTFEKRVTITKVSYEGDIGSGELKPTIQGVMRATGAPVSVRRG